MKLTQKISLISLAILLTGCATPGSEKSSSRTFTPLLVKNSGNYAEGSTHTAKLGDYIIKEPVEPQAMVKIESDATFKGRNPLVGVLGPEVTYNIKTGDKFFLVATSKSQKTYCQLDGEKFFKICLIDDDNNGEFEAHTLSVMQKEYGPGDLFQKKNFDLPVPYSETDKKTGLYYTIRYRRGYTKPNFFQYMIDEDENVIAELSGVTKPPKGEKPPYRVSFKGSEIEVTRWDDWQLEYKITKPVSSSLVLTRF